MLLRGRRRRSVRESAVEAEAVADVDAQYVPGTERGLEEALDQGVATRSVLRGRSVDRCGHRDPSWF
jgi:hypothetical protein